MPKKRKYEEIYDPPAPVAPPELKGEGPTLPLVIRGNFKLYRERFGITRIIIILGLSVLIYTRTDETTWVFLMIGLLVFFLGIGLLLKARSYTVYKDRLEYVNMFRQRIVVPLSDIRQVQVFPRFHEWLFGDAYRISIGFKPGRYALTPNALYWNAKDLEQLVIALRKEKVPVDYYDPIVGTSDLTYYFPDNATYIERHPGKVFLILLPIVIVIVIGIPLVIVLIEHS